jgi:hypothetical protein
MAAKVFSGRNVGQRLKNSVVSENYTNLLREERASNDCTNKAALAKFVLVGDPAFSSEVDMQLMHTMARILGQIAPWDTTKFLGREKKAPAVHRVNRHVLSLRS